MDENELLEKAINNLKNDSIVKLNSLKISNNKKRILSDLDLDKSEINNFLNKLMDYRYIDEISDLETGNYIRWISIKEGVEKIKLTTGGGV